MSDFLFYLFASFTLLAGIMVVLSRDAINSALYMIVSLLGIAALFFMLQAYFLGVLQILVYAGAVVVLFLFVIMLSEGKKEPLFKSRPLSFFCSVTALFILGIGVVKLWGSTKSNHFPAVQEKYEVAASLSKNFGVELFSKYMLPFQLSGLLLLVAMIGVVLLSSKKETTKNSSPQDNT
jgi:NADH-quinone oxidoreductase subunit J